jgi:hypothetical protein
MAQELDKRSKLPARRHTNGVFCPELPPVEAYAADFPSAPTTVAAVDHSLPRICVRTAAEVAATVARAAWLLPPYIERNAIVIFYGGYGTYKSFVSLDWAMRVALGMPALGHASPAVSGDVLFISAEGRGLAQRLRAWCAGNFPDESAGAVLNRTRLYCVEHPVNLSDARCARALVARIAELNIAPVLIVVDTMTRNSDGRIENSTTDASAYLAIIDQGLRAQYHCAVLLIHHVGHVEKGRIRGPIVLAANTDTLIRIERPDPQQRLATLTIERLKDSEPAPPQGLHAAVVAIGENDENGQPITSLVMQATACVPLPAAASKAELPGSAQRQLLAALKAQSGVGTWTLAEMRAIGRKAGMHKNSARSAAESLAESAHLVATLGGWRLADV